MTRVVGLDDVSRAIIEQLQQDGRRPYATIGKAVGLSEAAVRQRVNRLQETGVIQIVAVTDPMQVGFSRSAMVGIEVDGDMESVADTIAALPEVDYLVITAGSFDIPPNGVVSTCRVALGTQRPRLGLICTRPCRSYAWDTR